jgi:adenine-specific DNA-methyltransferase
VLKDQQGKKRTGNISTLQYLFEFLDAYDFGAKAEKKFRKTTKRLLTLQFSG